MILKRIRFIYDHLALMSNLNRTLPKAQFISNDCPFLLLPFLTKNDKITIGSAKTQLRLRRNILTENLRRNTHAALG
jgi:hypothetical protein